MKISRIKIENFLSFKNFEWKETHSDLNTIIGPNGAGKTNIFNALRMICDPLKANPSLLDMSSFAHVGDTSKPIGLEFDIRFNQQERDIIREFIGACFANQVSNRISIIDSGTDEALLGWLKDLDIEKFYEGTLIAKYDFGYKDWNINYVQNQFEFCNLSGNFQNQIAGESLEKLWGKFKEVLKVEIDSGDKRLREQRLSQIEGLQLSNLMVGDKMMVNLDCRIDGNRRYKSTLSFYELIESAVESYWLSKLFGKLFERAIVFSENIRPFPKAEFSSKEMEGSLSGAITSENIALFLFKLKNGNVSRRSKFENVKRNFNKLTEGLGFEILSYYRTKEIPLVEKRSMAEVVEVETLPIYRGDDKAFEFTTTLKIVITSKGNLETPIEYNGAGIWEALYFSGIAESNGSIYLLDEPAANVHPSRQKLFKDLFSGLADSTAGTGSQPSTQHSQIFMVTHSPYLVDVKMLENTSRFYLENGETKRKSYVGVENSQTKQTPDSKSHETTKREVEFLGRKIENILPLFSKGVFLIEGPTEFIVLPELFKKWAGVSLEEKGISAIYVEGKGNFGKYLKLFESFGIPWVILCDGDAIGPVEHYPSECECCGKKSGQKSTKFECGINNHLEQVKRNIDFGDLNKVDYQKRRSQLAEMNVYTTAKSGNENFDSFVNDLFVLFSLEGQGKIERAVKVAERMFEMNSSEKGEVPGEKTDEINDVLKLKFFDPIFEKVKSGVFKNVLSDMVW